MKSLLVLLDDNPSGAAARDVAIETGVRLGATVVGIGIIDVSAAYQAEAAALRSMTDDVPAAEGIDIVRGKVRGRLDAFEQACGDAGADYKRIELEGTPSEVLLAETGAHDLVVLGKDDNFDIHPKREEEELVANLLGSSGRPLLVVPSVEFTGEDVLIAYDGSPPADRALQLAVLLGLLNGKTAHIVTVQDSVEEAVEISSKAEAYLTAHGIAVMRHDVVDDGSPSNVISEKIKAIKPCLLVMGAYGHKSLREFLLGSSTSNLLQYSPVPVFVHH